MDEDFPPPMRPEDSREFTRRRRGRNVALLIALVALCLVLYGLSMVKVAGAH